MDGIATVFVPRILLTVKNVEKIIGYLTVFGVNLRKNRSETNER